MHLYGGAAAMRKAEHRKENSDRKLDAKVGRTLDTFFS